MSAGFRDAYDDEQIDLPRDLDGSSRLDEALGRARDGLRRFGRERVVRDRLPASAAALLGVVLAVPLIVWPTYAIRPTEPEPSGSPAFVQSFWAWDRIADTSGSGAFDAANTVGLVTFLVALVVGLAGVAVHTLRRGPDGRVLGAACFAWLAATVARSAAERIGRASSGLFGVDEGVVTVTTEPAGWLELASAVLLVGAVVLVALPPIVRLARSAYAWSREVVRRGDEKEAALAAAAEAAGPHEGEPARPRVGIATIRDVDPKDRATWRAPRTGGSGVGFSDDPEPAPTDRGSDPERFRPPR